MSREAVAHVEVRHLQVLQVRQTSEGIISNHGERVGVQEPAEGNNHDQVV